MCVVAKFSNVAICKFKLAEYFPHMYIYTIVPCMGKLWSKKELVKDGWDHKVIACYLELNEEGSVSHINGSLKFTAVSIHIYIVSMCV